LGSGESSCWLVDVELLARISPEVDFSTALGEVAGELVVDEVDSEEVKELTLTNSLALLVVAEEEEVEEEEGIGSLIVGRDPIEGDFDVIEPEMESSDAPADAS